jgi:DNA-binding transcriptional LysR family regulator
VVDLFWDRRDPRSQSLPLDRGTSGPVHASTQRTEAAPAPAVVRARRVDTRAHPNGTQVTDMNQAHAEAVPRPAAAGAEAPRGVELRHLRYFVAVADAGTFTGAAERLFVTQPTLSQQIHRLEQIVGTPLLHRRREGVQLTAAGTVLLAAARNLLAAAGHAVSQTRQAAGLDRPRLRIVLPADLPDSLAVQITSRLRSAAKAAQVAVILLETPLDGEFSPIRQRRADAGLGWLTASPDALPAPLEAISLGKFEPEVWIPSSHPRARSGVIGLDELVSLDVIHGPRRASPATYDRWLAVLRAVNPRFAFTDPPLRHSLPIVLALAATASPPAAVLTGPAVIGGPPPGATRLARPAGAGRMARVYVAGHPLTATAALVWNGDLPRPLQQILFDTADGAAPPKAGSNSPNWPPDHRMSPSPRSKNGTSACGRTSPYPGRLLPGPESMRTCPAATTSALRSSTTPPSLVRCVDLSGVRSITNEIQIRDDADPL